MTSRWHLEPVHVVPYDSAWPARYEQERALLEEAIAAWAPGGIHHIGSTAIPGLEAKPIIDILLGVESVEPAPELFTRLAGLGYLHAPWRVQGMHWFCKPDPRRRTHHLHLVPVGSERFRDSLLFRDYLREHRDTAVEYSALKLRLAIEFEHDRDGYTNSKSSFISATIRRAREP